MKAARAARRCPVRRSSPSPLSSTRSPTHAAAVRSSSPALGVASPTTDGGSGAWTTGGGAPIIPSPAAVHGQQEAAPLDPYLHWSTRRCCSTGPYLRWLLDIGRGIRLEGRVSDQHA
ncbi:unnamed protein product [Urochloa humidicola]